MSETSSFCFPCNLDIVANLKEKYNKWNDFFNLKHPIQDKQEFSIFAQQNRNLKLLTGKKYLYSLKKCVKMQLLV